MKLSIVTTLYRSSSTINEFYRRTLAAAESITEDIELVMVNDGSPDASLDIALDLHKSDRRVVVVDLSRNFGHHKAMMTGLAHATGDRVFLIDCALDGARGFVFISHAGDVRASEFLLLSAGNLRYRPVDAIYPDRTLPSENVEDKEDNRVFFYEVLPGRDEPLGSPCGSMKTGPIEADTPRTIELPPNPDAD